MYPSAAPTRPGERVPEGQGSQHAFKPLTSFPPFATTQFASSSAMLRDFFLRASAPVPGVERGDVSGTGAVGRCGAAASRPGHVSRGAAAHAPHVPSARPRHC